MDVEESSGVGCRRRRESNGGSSDSDLSEGWNIVDHLDANSPEALSSDGESVEVIEAEEESSLRDADSDKEGDVPVTEAAEQVSGTALVSANEALPPAAEEMFESSHYWILLTVLLALVCSNLAFLTAESVLLWNRPGSGLPSFLKDLPIMPKSLLPNNCGKKVSWASDQDAIVVDSVVNTFSKSSEKTVFDKSLMQTDDKLEEKLQETKNINLKERPTLQIDNQDLGEYLKVLSDMSISAEAQKKFAQSMLILDALHIGIHDLEGAVPESSELNILLKKQKNKLNDALTEVKFGVSRSMERLATNVLNKVETLERRFENQWCELEKNGHKDELKGLFYDCDESRHIDNANFRSDKKHKDKSKNKIDVNKKNCRKKKVIVDNYKYEVDKDSTGKVYIKENNENGGSSEYYKLVKDDKKNKQKHKPQDYLDYDKANKKFSTKESKEENNFVKDGKYSKENNENGGSSEYYKLVKDGKKNKHKPHNSLDYDKTNKKMSTMDSKEEHYLVKDGKKNKKNHRSQGSVNYAGTEEKMSAKEAKKENHFKNSGKQFKESHHVRKDKHSVDSKDREYEKPAEEVLGRFFKERCAKELEKLRISKELFDYLYFKFCEQNLGDGKEDSKREKQYLKRDYNDNIFRKENVFRNNQHIVEEPDKRNRKFKIIESPYVNIKEADKFAYSNKREVEPDSLKEWTMSYEIPPSTNKTDVDGYWFFKAGESRSHVRWFHQRSDWWFDRASQRRHNQYGYPHPSSWYVGRHKNWFFRRAWARQQCRVSPHNSWCRLGDETVTVPPANLS